jgi:hypothetical protein
MKWWRVTWRFVIVAIAIGLALYAVWRLLGYYYPYSTRFNGGAIDATTPLGVQATAHNQVTASGSVLANVLLEAVAASGTVNDTYATGASFRVILLNKEHQPVKLDSPVTVTLSSTSTSAQFDTTTAAQVAAGKSELLVHYRDTAAGSATISAFLSDVTGSSLKVTLVAKTATGLGDISPPQKSPSAASDTVYTVQVLDAYGNAADGDVVWRLIAADGSVQPLGTIASNQAQARLVWRPTPAQVGQKYTLEAALGGVKRTLIITPSN